MSESLLNVQGVQTFYGASQILFGVDLAIREREVMGLLGRNGMGKTTLIRSILGLTQAKVGRIEFAGHDIMGMKPYTIAQRGLAVVPEGRQIFPNLTVDENLRSFEDNRSQSADPWVTESVYELFPRLKERRQNLGNQLSGGEQQMLAIGRALVVNPKLMILDEATEGLAPLIRQEIWSCLTHIKQQGMALIVVDKYVQKIVEIADHVVIMEKGQIAWRGTSRVLGENRDLWHRYLGA
jgi:branched-chain amino acid transport system ATP-binding protein